MALTLDPINSGYSQVRINENFQAIENEINNRVLRRDKEVAEPNEMQIDLDLNDNNVLNVNSLDTNELTLNGVPVTTASEGVVDIPTAEFVPNVPAGDIASTNVQAALNELDTEKAPVNHTHLEADITDLDKYTQAQVDSALSTKVDDSDIGVTVQAYDIDTAKTDVKQVFTAPQKPDVLTDNDFNFDLALKQTFNCTPTGPATIGFSVSGGVINGQSGHIMLDNSGGHVISKLSSVKTDADFLTTVSQAGEYVITYIAKDNTKVYMVTSGAMS